MKLFITCCEVSKKMSVFLFVVALGLAVIFTRNMILATVMASIGQAAGLMVSYPQWRKMYLRKSASDISVESLFLLVLMITFMGASAVMTHASWIILANFGISLVSNLITAEMAVYYQGKDSCN